MDKISRTQLTTLISLLQQGRIVDFFSLSLSIAALIWLILLSAPVAILALILCSFIAGVLEKYYAFRVSLDYQLFSYLVCETDVSLKLTELDHALSQLGLIKQPQAIRSWESRQQGALVLFKKQVLYCSIQVVLFIMVALWVILRGVL